MLIDYRYTTFLEVAKQLNYTKAAQRLNLSQPAVTKHIKFIEDELQVKLFYYHNRILKLTVQGQILLDSLLKINLESQKLKDKLHAEYTQKIDLTVGACQVIGHYYIPKQTGMIKKPTTYNINFFTSNTSTILKYLESGQIDLALITAQSYNAYEHEENLRAIPFSVDQLVLACSPKHPCANQEVSFEILEKERFLCRETGSMTKQIIDNYFQTQKIDFYKKSRNFRVMNDIEIIKKIIRQNKGIGFLYQESINDELNHHELAEIHLTHFNRSLYYYLIYSTHTVPENHVEAFLNLLTVNPA